ncbi:MAG: hypothetical protein ACI9XO_004473 [Paraglaciecola sp.]|jgi:hypothetical protein
MNSHRKTQDYIDKYWNGEVSEEDFQAQLKSDVRFVQEYELYKKELQVIRAGAKNQLRKRAAFVLNRLEEKQPRIVQLKRVMAIAACFVLLVTGYLIFQNFGHLKSNDELFATHFELPAPANERNGTNQSEVWEKAMNAYIHQNFEKTINLLLPVIEQPDFHFKERGKLYLGISYLMTNKAQNAVNSFEKINQESSYFPDAQWFIALSFLKMENTTAAKEALQKIANQLIHFKHKEALKVLKQL